MRKVFLDDLPKWGKEGHGKEGTINWEKSTGKLIHFIYNNIESNFEIINYDKEKQKVNIKYNNNIYLLQTNKILNCKIKKILNIEKVYKFKIEIGEHIKDNKRNLTIIDKVVKKKISSKGRERYELWYKYKCNKCGWDEGWVEEKSLVYQQTGCSCCCIFPRVVVQGINDIPTTAPWMVKYFQGGYDEAKLYNKSSDKSIIPICPDCGNIKDKLMSINTIYNEHSIGCKYCGDNYSYPNKFGLNLLEQLNIEFEYEFSPDWIKPRRYDFYFELNDKKYILEMDGNFHYTDNLMNGDSVDEVIIIDKYKDNSAKEHNIIVIRIDCRESDLDYIKNNILYSKLNDLFDLSNINWLKCEEFALSNLCKKVCEIKNNNFNISTYDISKILKINRGVVIKYLKKGSKLDWCIYNAKEEMIKSGEATGKKVEIFKDNVSLGIFKSCNDLEIQSEYLFGVKLYRSSISSVCNGKYKTYKNYVFKYV